MEPKSRPTCRVQYVKASNDIRPLEAYSAQTRAKANWLIGVILVLLFAINMATSDRLPIVSEDEAYYADPGVTSGAG